MRFLEVVKRIIPFVAALVIGLFVASFFVSLSAPTVRVERSWKKSKHGDYHRLERQNRYLKKENCRLKREQRKIRSIEREFDTLIELVPPPPPMAPEPPAAPLAPPPPPPPPVKVIR